MAAQLGGHVCVSAITYSATAPMVKRNRVRGLSSYFLIVLLDPRHPWPCWIVVRSDSPERYTTLLRRVANRRHSFKSIAGLLKAQNYPHV